MSLLLLKHRPRCLSIFLIGILVLCTPDARSAAAQPSVNPDEITDASTAADVFASMKKGFNAPASKGVHATYQFEISGPQGGMWWIIVNDGDFTMGKGVLKKPDVIMVSTDKDWVRLASGSLSGFRAYLTGRLKVTGNQRLARKLDDVFP